VSYLHSKNICHSDLKLENLVLRENSHPTDEKLQICLADFGFSKQLAAGEKISSSHGTLGYAAPELLF
jgi:serine/threonine protein kinase